MPLIQPPDSSVADTKDDAEAMAFSEGRDLSKEKQEADHERFLRFHWHLSYGIIIILWIAIIVLSAMGLCWAFHMISPERYHFLDAAQLSDIKTILFSGGVGAFGSGDLKRVDTV